MNKKIKRYGLFLILIILMNNGIQARENDFPKLTGPYLGQKPPGTTPKIFAPGIVSNGSHDLNITISPDLNEIYITRSGPDWFSAILVFKNSKSGWSTAKPVNFSGLMQGHYPFISVDGKTMYFNAPNAGGDNDSRIWTASYENGEFKEWKMLDAAFNTNELIMFPSVSRTGAVYFAMNKEDGLGGFDLYRSVHTEKGYTDPENLGPEINSSSNEFHTYIAPDESYIIFDSQRSGGFGKNDLYISFRKSNGGWTPAENMGKIINSESGDQRPYVSPDGKYLFFCSDRPNPQVNVTDKPLTYSELDRRINGPGNGFQDIYWVDAGVINELKTKTMKRKN